MFNGMVLPEAIPKKYRTFVKSSPLFQNLSLVGKEQEPTFTRIEILKWIKEIDCDYLILTQDLPEGQDVSRLESYLTGLFGNPVYQGTMETVFALDQLSEINGPDLKAEKAQDVYTT